MVANTRKGAQPQSQAKLKFREKLIVKGQSTDVLLKKLKTLTTELMNMDQEVDAKSLDTVRKDLINRSLLLHKDRGVKAYVSCCIADMLRVYAPNAPYSQGELQDIFQFFFNQLKLGLKGTDSAYYSEYYQLLESLSTVKSVVLICDLPHADDLVLELFRSFFTIVQRDLPKNVGICMSDILVAVLDELGSWPDKLLETIMTQFMGKNKGPEDPEYRLAMSVCNEAASKLQRHVSMYFADIIVTQAEEEAFDDICAAHELIKRLNACCPAILHSVVPQLDQESRAEDTQIRLIATQTLGEMFAEKSAGDLVKQHPATWLSWLSRRNDKNTSVRLKFVQTCKGLLSGPVEQRAAIEDALRAKLMDPDEKVRTAVCKLYHDIDYETALHHVSVEQLRALAGRAADKKASVREEALNTLGKIYSMAYPEIESNDQNAFDHFAWIPNHMLSLYNQIVEVRSPVSQAFTRHILPLPSGAKGTEVDEVAWTERLLNMMKYLDDKAVISLLNMSGLQSTRPTAYDLFIDACIQNNGGIIDENEELVKRRLAKIIQQISFIFPDPQKAQDDLEAFSKLNESRLYKLSKTCMDVHTDLKGLVKAYNELQRRLDHSSPSIAPTITYLVRKGGLRIISVSSIPTLLTFLAKRSETASAHVNASATNAQKLLTVVHKHCPALFEPHMKLLSETLINPPNPESCTIALQALASIAKRDASKLDVDKLTFEHIRKLVTSTGYRNAKFAAQFLAFCEDKDEVCNEVIDEIADGLPEATEAQLASYTAVLTQMTRFAPNAFERRSDDLVPFLLKKVIMVPIPLPRRSSDKDEQVPDESIEEEWAEDADVPDMLRAKIATLKIWRYRCLAHTSSKEVCAPVLKLYLALLKHSGSPTDAPEDPKAMSRMRLQAAISLVYLAKVEAFAPDISMSFVRLALVVQDSCFNVRQIFLSRVIKTLAAFREKLPPAYNLIPFLTVHDPETEIKGMASSYIATTVKRLPPDSRLKHFEMIFIRLLHLLAHHPDFGIELDDVKDLSKYIVFYLDLVATQDNIQLLYHLAMKAKTVRLADTTIPSDNLYVLSELAQEWIKLRAQQRGWTVQSYPGKVKLPSDILRALESPEASREIASTKYLKNEAETWLLDLGKTKEKRERRPYGTGAATKRKAASGGEKAAKRPRTSKKRQTDDEDDDEEDDFDDASSEDVAMADPADDDDDDEEEEEEAGDGDEQLGRGARSRAKAKAKRQEKIKARKARRSSEG